MNLDLDFVKKIGLDKGSKISGKNPEVKEATNKDLSSFGFKIIQKKGTRSWAHLQ